MISLINSTIRQNWPMLVLVLIVYLVFRFLKLNGYNKKIKIFEECYMVLFIIYTFLLVSIISYGELNLTSGINLVPFKEILRYELFSDLFMLNVVGNIILFAPLGYFLGYYTSLKKVSVVMFYAALISFSGELLQRYVGRTFDIDDILLNVIGASLGYMIYSFLYKLYRKLPNIFQKDGLYNVLCIIIILLLILYILEVIGVINLV